MNIYDFDGTIYHGDSTYDFYKYCIKKRPKVLIYLPETIFYGIGFLLKIVKKLTFKKHFYHFLKVIDTEMMVEAFWREHQKNIYHWYYEKHEDTDIFISASPDFLLRPMLSKLGVTRLIASKVDPQDGTYDGENCWGGEKVRRLYEEYHITRCDEFYSDSYSDTPLAEIADKAYRITKDGDIIPWY